MVEHHLSGRNAAFLNFDLQIDRARFLAASALPPAEALRSLGNPEVPVVDEAKRNLLLRGRAELFFWRTRTQLEVDLVIKSGDRLRVRGGRVGVCNRNSQQQFSDHVGGRLFHGYNGKGGR